MARQRSLMALGQRAPCDGTLGSATGHFPAFCGHSTDEGPAPWWPPRPLLLVPVSHLAGSRWPVGAGLALCLDPPPCLYPLSAAPGLGPWPGPGRSSGLSDHAPSAQPAWASLPCPCPSCPLRDGPCGGQLWFLVTCHQCHSTAGSFGCSAAFCFSRSSEGHRVSRPGALLAGGPGWHWICSGTIPPRAPLPSAPPWLRLLPSPSVLGRC